MYTDTMRIKNNQFIPKICAWLLRFAQLQLFISLIAFPILLCWGLPLSPLSILGNLLFGPILTLFLFLSSVLFFTELIHIPNKAIAWLLDMVTNLWLKLLHVESHPWLYGFPKPPLVLLLTIPLLAILMLHFRKFKHSYQTVLCLVALLLGSCFYIKTAYTTTQAVETMPCNRGTITIVHDQQNLIVIDPGVIGQKISAATWVEYTLIPHIIKTSGKTTIDSLILLQPGALLFEAITTLVSKIHINTIYLVYWQGSLTKPEWAHFFSMQQACKENGVTCKRISDKPIIITTSDKNSLTITPLPTTIKQKEISYPAVQITGSRDQKPFTVTSYKYTRK